MFLYLFCIFNFVVASFGINDTYIHFSDDETDQYFPNNTVNVDMNDDFEFPWTHESKGLQTLSLKNIIELFVQQYGGGITSDNRWLAMKQNPKDQQWHNLCDQTWHNRGKRGFVNINCTAKERLPTSRLWIWMPNGKKLKADYLKCACPDAAQIMGYSYRLPVTNSNHNFLVVRHTDTDYFTLIYVESRIAIIHGFVRNIQSPFSETLDTTRKYYYMDEAREIYKRKK